MSQKTAAVELTGPELSHLWALLTTDDLRGDYYGNEKQYRERHKRIIAKFKAAEQELGR
jgi:hypothetical protein